MGSRLDSAKARLGRGMAWAKANVKRVLQDPRLRSLIVVVVVVLSFAIMGYLVYRNWHELEPYRQHLQVHYPLIILAFLLYPAGLVPNAIGWHAIMSRLGGLPDFKANARIYCYSCLPRRIPGGVWHIAGRAYLNKEQGVPHALTLLGTSLEWVLLVVSGLLVYLLSNLSPLLKSAEGSGLSPGVALVLFVPLLALLFPPLLNRIVNFLLRKFGVQQHLAIRVYDILALLAVYLIAWTMGGVVLYVLIRALFPLPLATLPAVIGAWGGAGALGFVAAYFLQGLGVREVTLSVLLGSFMPLPIAIIASILFRILLTVGEVVYPLLWVRFLP